MMRYHLRLSLVELPPIRSGISREYTGTIINQKRTYLNIRDDDETWKKYINEYLIKVKDWGGFDLNGLTKGVKPISIWNWFRVYSNRKYIFRKIINFRIGIWILN
jgi:hypothetical protein